MKILNIDPTQYRDTFHNNGFVVMPGGICPGFLEYAQTFTRDALAHQSESSLKEWHVKNKKRQFLFEFPEGSDVEEDVKAPLAVLTGIPHQRATLCERHIKVYERRAAAHPPPHKDRLASQITVGIPLEIPEQSYLVLYPQHERDTNLFASSAEYRASLDPEQLPERRLATVKPVALSVWPGDLVVFQGSSMYHERINPAGTALLYLKLNGMNLDPLGEDPATVRRRENSLAALEQWAGRLPGEARLMISPRLERVSRHYSRLSWCEVLQASLWSEREVTLDENEWAMVRALGDRPCSVSELLRRLGSEGPPAESALRRLERLLRTGVLHLENV